MPSPIPASASDDVETPELSLERNSYVPYYRQVRDQLASMIKSGRLRPGQTICSEGTCATQLGISKMTVRQAFQALRSDGLLIIEKGKRPSVSTGRLQKDFHRLLGFTEEMSRRGLKASSKLLQIEKVFPDAATANLLHLLHNEEVFRIRRLRFANKDVVGVETAVLPARLCPDLEEQDLESQSLYTLMETRYNIGVQWSEEELEALPAQKEEAKLLQVGVGFPLFSMRRIAYGKDDAPVEFTHSLFRSDRYSAKVVSRRES
jgi:GntR family transcriptional regulator